MRREARETDPLDAALRAAIRAPRVPAGLAERVLARVPRATAETAGPQTARSPWWRGRFVAAAALVAASLLAAAVGEQWLPGGGVSPRGDLGRAVEAGAELLTAMQTGGVTPRPLPFGLGMSSEGGFGVEGFELGLGALPLGLDAGLATLGALLLAAGRGGGSRRRTEGAER